MSLVQSLSVAFVLALCVVPVLLLRRPLSAGASEQQAPPAIVRNAWIAYALRLSAFVALFAWGAAGDVWPAIAGAAGYGGGVYLLARLRRPVSASADDPQRRAPTLHAFVAQACGGAAGLRATVALTTVVALLGLAGGEVAALVAVATPLVGEGAGLIGFVMLLVLAGSYAVAAGTNGVRYASQALLGAIYIGLFGSAVFLLYLNASDLRPMPEHGAFALISLTACCVAVLVYRQTKYIETPHLAPPEDRAHWRRIVSRQVRLLQRFVNVAISVLAVTAVVIAGMEFYFLGLPETLRNGVAALGTAPHVPAVGCVGIAVLALAYPLADAASWRNADALAESTRAAGAAASFRRPIRMVAGESALMGILLAAFGAIAALSTDLTPDAAGMPDFVRQLVLFDNEITDAALTLLLVGGFAMAMSTTGMAFSTAMSVIRLDILPALRPGTEGAGPGHRAALAALSAVAIVVTAVWIVSGVPSAGVVDARFFVVALAFACLQVSLLPLVLVRLRGLALPGIVALAVPAGGSVAALGSIALYGATADPLWLWLAAPICLLAGLLPVAAASLLGRAAPPKAERL